MAIEYRGYNLETEPWQEFFKGFTCWIRLGWLTVARTVDPNEAEVLAKAKRLIDHWKENGG